MEYETILYELESGVLTITFNRPERLNAFSPEMNQEFRDAIARADADDDVRAVIVTGAGRAFSSGADLSRGGDTFDNRVRGGAQDMDEHRDRGGLMTLAIFESKKPMIAAINGPAVGVGITVTLPMDIRLASEDARIGFVFTRRGLVPEAASSWFLPRIVGISQAQEWVLSGHLFPASEALAGGLVRSIHPPDELLPAAQELAHEIADNCSAVSVALTRQMMWQMLAASHPMDAHRIDSKAIFWLGQQPDVREGVASFTERRAPAFSMRPSCDMPPFYPWWEEPPFRA